MAVQLSAGSPERFGYEWQSYSELRPEYDTEVSSGPRS